MDRKVVVKTFTKIDKLKGIVLSYIKLSSMFNSNQNAIDSLCNSNVDTDRKVEAKKIDRW